MNRHPNDRRPLRPWVLGPALAIVLAACLASTAQATPRYAARFNERCALCHDDPSGGGKRSLYAAQYLVSAELVAHPLDSTMLARIQPALGPNVSVGADLRTVHHYADRPQELPPGFAVPNFFQMEGTFYVTFQPVPRVTVCMARGLTGNYEIYGLVQGFPANAHIRVGRFVPPYGWRLPDHTAFVRSFGGWMPPLHSDVGVEVGCFPGRIELQVAATNGARGSTQDVDRDLAVTARAMRRLRLGGLAFAYGGSYAWNGAPEVKTTAYGPFAALSWKEIAWWGQADWLEEPAPGGGTVRGLNLSQELAVPLHRGLDFLVTHDFHDPDIDEKSGALSRYGVGLEYFALPFLQLRALANTYVTEPAGGGANRDAFQSEVQARFIY